MWGLGHLCGCGIPDVGDQIDRLRATRRGDATTAVIGERILHAIVEVASGRPTCSERLGYGLEEFVPWTDGITL